MMVDKIAMVSIIVIIFALGYCGYQFWLAGLDTPCVDLETPGVAALDRGRRRR